MSKVEIKGMDQLIKNLSRYPDALIERVVIAAQMSQARIVNDAKSDHPYKDQTGNLTNSIQPAEVIITDAEIVAYVAARMEYASFVELGTSRARAFPFLVPAMLREASNYRRTIAQQVKAIQL